MLFVSGTLVGGTEKGIDKFYVLMFSGTDENKSWYIEDNIKTYTEAGQVNASDPDFQDSNYMRCKVCKTVSGRVLWVYPLRSYRVTPLGASSWTPVYSGQLFMQVVLAARRGIS